MRSFLRPSLAAAALLLAPLGTLLVAGPAAAQSRAPAYVADNHDWNAGGRYDRHDRYDDRGWQHRRDRTAPQITQLTPDHRDRLDDRGRTRIVARFHDEGSGVDLRSIRLRLNGSDVTHMARVEPDSVRLRADLAPGRYFAEVLVADRAGNLTRRNWSFDVVDRDWRHGGGYGPAYRAPQRW